MLFKRLLLSSLFYVCTTQLFALDLELTQGVNSALPIAINAFGYEGVGHEITETINNDLRISGQFKIISPPPATPVELNSVSFWRQVGADSLLTGQVNQIDASHYVVNFELLDAVTPGKVLLKNSFQIPKRDVRALAHHISDVVYEKLTGERGIFSTRIAYVLVKRLGEQSRYSLEIADADGRNPQSLLVSSEPIMSPSWSPDGQQIAYVSFEKKKAQIYTVAVETGQRRLVTNFPGINGAPAWSVDGKQLAVVLSKGGNPKIYTVDLSNGYLKQLTFGESIDTEPRYAPDGQNLIFTSGRGGAPQVYKLNLINGSISRITYDGNYNARASFTPDQKRIVMLHREEDKRFNIGVQEGESGRVIPLTFSTLDESPSIAPNGRLVLYATRHQDKGVLGIVSIDGRIRMRIPAREGDIQEPAWSPYLS